MSGLKGKVAIITGASSGIGAVTAILLASKGTYLTITGRNAENLEKISNECIKAGLPSDKILQLLGDVTDDTFLEKIVNETIAKFGKIDILVNNAGIYQQSPNFKELFDLIINTNLRSAYVLSHLSIPHLKKTKGTIVNVSSSVSMIAHYQSTPYSISKAGMDHMTNCMASEFSKFGIRINTVNPGIVHSDIMRSLEVPEEGFNAFANETQLESPGRPEEVAEAIAYLISDTSSYVTGTHLKIDGGICLNYGKME